MRCLYVIQLQANFWYQLTESSFRGGTTNHEEWNPQDIAELEQAIQQKNLPHSLLNQLFKVQGALSSWIFTSG